MIGVWPEFAPLFVRAVALGSLALLGLPMVLRPLSWARRLGWRVQDNDHLAIYFGRCLGAVIVVLAVFAFQAAGNPVLLAFFMRILAVTFAAMVLVHCWGALRRIQPLSETVEIMAWVLLLAAALLVMPG